MNIKSPITLQQDAFRLNDFTLPDFFRFIFELRIESSNFNHKWSGPWRSILGLTNGGSGPGRRQPTFFLRHDKKLFLSVYTASGSGSSIDITLDEWPSFKFCFPIINRIHFTKNAMNRP